MVYKGYTASIRFDEEGKLLSGEVIGIADTVTFVGASVEEFIQAFHDSVDDYLEFCAQEGKEPDRPFNGKVLVRCESDLHKAMVHAAEAKGLTLNQWIIEAVRHQLGAEGGEPVLVRAA